MVAAPAIARAQAEATVTVACAQLSNEEQGALQTRAQADLSVRGMPEGDLSFTCNADQVLIVWAPSQGVRRVGRTTLTEGPQRVEHLLEGMDRLFGARVVPKSSPRASAPARPPVAPNSTLPRLVAFAGPRIEVWAGEAILGPSVGLEPRVAGTLAVRTWVAAQWGLASPSSTQARVVEAGLGFDLKFGAAESFALGAGAVVGSLHVSAEHKSPPSSTAVLAGAWFSVRYSAELGFARLAFGPELRGYGRYHAVAIDGAEVLRQPSFTVGAVLQLEYAIVR